MLRREFLKGVAASVVGSAILPEWGGASGTSSPAFDRPNILFVLGDDNAWPHAGCYGDKVVRTPAMDRVAAAGAVFSSAFCCTPSCTASRAGIVTGQWPHRLGDSINLWSPLAGKHPTYPAILQQAGYRVGYAGKGYGPGGDAEKNPAGPRFKSFEEFLKGQPADKPFCFWFGSRRPHRPYGAGSGVKAGLKVEDVRVPAWLPDDVSVRSDILDYYAAVEQFDTEIDALLRALEQSGRSANTLVVISGDNGMPFPRAKANLYDSGCRQPLIVRWPGRVEAGARFDPLVSLIDLAPTFLEAAGVQVPAEMTGRSLLGLLTGKAGAPVGANRVFFERDRHARAARAGGLGYPGRAIRTPEFLFVLNLAPDRWPAGDPEGFDDVDPGAAKQFILDRRNDDTVKKFYQLAFAKRPAEELYDLKADPDQLVNVAGRPEYIEVGKRLRAELADWMRLSGDPLAK